MIGQILNHYIPLLPHLHNGGTMVMPTLWGFLLELNEMEHMKPLEQ